MIEERIAGGFDTSVFRVLNDAGETVRYLVKTTDNYTVTVLPEQWKEFAAVIRLADLELFEGGLA